MKFAVLRVSLCVAAIVLAGCSSIGLETKKIDYKSASAVKVPTLEIPPDLTSPTRDDRYAVPDSLGRGSATFSQYAGERGAKAQAQQSVVLPKVDKTRIERSGNQRWLVVGETPDKLWDQVKDFYANPESRRQHCIKVVGETAKALGELLEQEAERAAAKAAEGK